MKTKNYKCLIKSILLPLILGTIVGFLTSLSMDSFNMLDKPFLSPPGIIFPIVWTVLYILMGISFYLVNNEDVEKIYYTQLFVNLTWSFIFFTFKLYLLSFIWILILIYLVIKMIIKFYKYNKTAAYLLIPYLIWITFAAYLNLGISILN